MRYRRLLETPCRLRFRFRHRLPLVGFRDNHLLSSSSSSSLSSLSSLLSSSSSEDGGGNNNYYEELRNEAQDLIEKESLKVYGSLQHTKLRRTYTNVFCDTVRAGLREKIQMRCNDNGDGANDDNVSAAAAAAAAATKKLEADLGGIGADQGIMPDFSNKEALYGYTLNHFGRVRLTSELVTSKSLSKPDWLSLRVAELLSSSSSSSSSQRRNNNIDADSDDLSIASLGGGGGYDFVAFSALSEFLKGPSIKTTVYEYEPAWKDIVSDVEMVVQDSCSSNNNNSGSGSASASASGQQPRDHHQQLHTCGFEFGDITSPLDASTNEAIASMVNSTEIFSCSYVIAENAVKLQQNKFEFFRQLFSEAADGSLFFFTETTHRLWPDLIDLASRRQDDNNSFMRYTLNRIRHGKSGWQLALLKDSATAGDISFSSRSCSKSEEVRAVEKELIERFKRDNIAHQLRIDRGWKRDEKKVRGAK